MRKPPARAAVKADPVALFKLIEDLLELENHVPWRAVMPVWGSKRAAWARRTRECTEVAAVAEHVNILVDAMVADSFIPQWRDEVREKWRGELLRETDARKVRGPFSTLATPPIR